MTLVPDFVALADLDHMGWGWQPFGMDPDLDHSSCQDLDSWLSCSAGHHSLAEDWLHAVSSLDPGFYDHLHCETQVS